MIDAPIDHVAIVVKDLDAALRLYTQTLGFSVVYREPVADQGVEAVGLRSGDAVIELLRPLSEDSPVAAYRGDAQTRLQRARDNLLKALYDHNVARLALATATGTIAEYVNQ